MAFDAEFDAPIFSAAVIGGFETYGRGGSITRGLHRGRYTLGNEITNDRICPAFREFAVVVEGALVVGMAFDGDTNDFRMGLDNIGDRIEDRK